MTAKENNATFETYTIEELLQLRVVPADTFISTISDCAATGAPIVDLVTLFSQIRFNLIQLNHVLLVAQAGVIKQEQIIMKNPEKTAAATLQIEFYNKLAQAALNPPSDTEGKPIGHRRYFNSASGNRMEIQHRR